MRNALILIAVAVMATPALAEYSLFPSEIPAKVAELESRVDQIEDQLDRIEVKVDRMQVSTISTSAPSLVSSFDDCAECQVLMQQPVRQRATVFRSTPQAYYTYTVDSSGEMVQSSGSQRFGGPFRRLFGRLRCR